MLITDLENRIAKEAPNHRITFDSVPETHNQYISGTLLHEFTEELSEFVKQSTKAEASDYLGQLLSQCKSHTPDNRKLDFYRRNKFIGPDKEGADLLWDSYTYHFDSFLKVAERAYRAFIDGYVGKDLSVKSNKLKTTLNVEQLVLLFKMLNDLKPGIFELASNEEFLRFISESFETKKSGKESHISIDKIRNLFYTTDPKAADFWEKHFHTLVTEVKKYK